jgi:hypothetical protein
MDSDQVFFAGVEISSGRRPVTLAVLDSGLNVIQVEQCAVTDAISYLSDQDAVQLVINTPGTRSGADIHLDFKRRLKPASFTQFSKGEGARTWIDASAQDWFRAFRPKLFPKRTLEGRIQRALILYEEGVQIPDPMDFFEEITRHKLLQGLLPDDIINSLKQLDALIAAYVAWLSVHRPHRAETRGDLVLPTIMENV